MAVRGARNYPCMGHPGKRAPTVEICNSDKPFMPLAMRQHTLGPYPLDPNLLAQGVPPDDRITGNDRIFGPVGGTPLPPGAVPRGTPAGPRGENPPPDTVGAAVPPVPSSGPRLAPMSPMSADVPAFAPLDVPAPGELPARTPATRCAQHHRIRSTVDSLTLRQARSEATHLSPRRRSWWQSTIRTPVGMSVRTGSCTSSRISRPRRRLRRGRTCFPLKAVCGWAGNEAPTRPVRRAGPGATASRYQATGFARRHRLGRPSCPCRTSVREPI